MVKLGLSWREGFQSFAESIPDEFPAISQRMTLMSKVRREERLRESFGRGSRVQDTKARAGSC
jgi:hypothetical protein